MFIPLLFGIHWYFYDKYAIFAINEILTAILNPNAMVKENMNSKPKDSQKTKKQRLAPRILYKTVCEILEEALKEDSTIESEDGGFVRIDIIDDYILEKQDEIVTKRERDNYTTDYKAYELIKQVNTALKK